MIDGIPAAAYTPLAEGVSGPVLSVPAGATYSVDGTVSGLGVLRSAGGVALAAQGGGAMSQLGMLSSGASVVNQLSGGSLYSGIGRSLVAALLAQGDAVAVLDLLRRRMESVADSLTDVVSEDVPNRILKLLRRIAQSQGGYRNGEWLLDLRLTHQELGNMIGARRQTVTTAINDMHRLGVLRREQQRIVVAAEAREITMKSAVRSGARAALWASAVAVAALFGVEVSAIV
jgi:hypothetical protein